MAFPTNRETFKRWCLSKLGWPVVKVNIAEEQMERCVDETLERFKEHHFDGTQRMYMKRAVTASTMTFSTPLGFTLTKGTEIVGQTSGAKGAVHSQASDNLSIQFTTRSGAFQAGEVIETPLGNQTSATITLGDIDNGWIPVDDSIVGVIQVVPTGGLLGSGLFSYTYQQALQFLPNFPTGGMNYFVQQKQHLALIEELFVGDKILVHQRMMNRVTIDINWKESISVGEYIILDVYKAVDPNEFNKIWSNCFVREYATALMMQQWGQNLSKFNGVVMLNGTTLNGEGILKRGDDMLEKLEKRLQDEFQAPPGFYVG